MTRVHTLVAALTLAFAGPALAGPIKDPGQAPDPKQEPSTDKPDRNKMTIDQLPTAVQAAVQRETGGRQLDAIRKDTIGGDTVYKVTLMMNGKNQSLTFSASGKVIARDPDRDNPTPTPTPAPPPMKPQ